MRKTGQVSPGGPRRLRPPDGWISLAPGAETAFAAQCAISGLLWMVTIDLRDDYDAGYGGGLAIVGLLCMLVFTPPILFLYGWLHAWLFAVPVMLLSDALGVRTRVPAPRWALPALVLLSAAYATPLAALGAPYVATCGSIAVIGAIPTGVAVCARMRQWPKAKVRKRVLIATGVAVPLIIGGAVAGSATGLMPGYRPPVLERADLVGEWTGDGTRLVLGEDGEVTARELPVEIWGKPEAGSCTGTGTWKELAAVGAYRAGVSLTIPECKGAEMNWSVAGTDQDPELFVLMGDLDSGDLRILHKR